MFIKNIKDTKGKPSGPWFVKYPYRRNPATGRIHYKIEKVGPSKKLAQRIYSAKYEEYKKREHLDWVERQPLTFNQLADWYLELPSVKERRNTFRTLFDTRKAGGSFSTTTSAKSWSRTLSPAWLISTGMSV